MWVFASACLKSGRGIGAPEAPTRLPDVIRGESCPNAQTCSVMNQQILSPHQAQTKVEGVGTNSTFATEPGFGKAAAIFVTSPPPSGTSGRWLFLRNRACREEQTYSSCSPPRRAGLTSGNQFGMDEGILREVIQHRRENVWLFFAGIQYFSGTQRTMRKIVIIQFIDRTLNCLVYR